MGKGYETKLTCKLCGNKYNVEEALLSVCPNSSNKKHKFES